MWLRRLLSTALAAVTVSPLRAETSALEAPGPSGILSGTLLSPAAATSPPLLIIPGSGPTDRDGNSPLGVRASTYRVLAEDLAAEGVPSLRIDKRGLFGSAAAIPDPDAVTLGDYAADVAVWNKILRERTGARCAWLLGHSEGGLVALAAAKNAPEVCGLILVATPGRRLGAILREQLRGNPANVPILAEAERAIDRLEAGQRVDGGTLHPALAPLFRPAVQGFLIDMFAHDPASMIAGLQKPILILHGGRDLQLSRADAERLKAAQPDSVLRVIPDANHVLKHVGSDDAVANLATYGEPDLPLVPEIVPAIAQFIRDHPPEP